MALDVTAQEDAREELNRHVRAHDETLNHVPMPLPFSVPTGS